MITFAEPRAAGIEEIMAGEQQNAHEAIRHAIREERTKHGWTQQELAVRSGVSRPTIARLEAGRSVSSTTLIKMVAALGLQVHVEHKPPHAHTGEPQRSRRP